MRRLWREESTLPAALHVRFQVFTPHSAVSDQLLALRLLLLLHPCLKKHEPKDPVTPWPVPANNVTRYTAIAVVYRGENGATTNRSGAADALLQPQSRRKRGFRQTRRVPDRNSLPPGPAPSSPAPTDLVTSNLTLLYCPRLRSSIPSSPALGIGTHHPRRLSQQKAAHPRTQRGGARKSITLPRPQL